MLKTLVRLETVAFDLCKVAAWVDTEGSIIITGAAKSPRSSVRVKVVQKEREPLEEYCRLVSKMFGLRCAVRALRSTKNGHTVAWMADPAGNSFFLGAIEPYIETRVKRRQIAQARSLLAERGFRLTFLAEEELERRRRDRERWRKNRETRKA